VVSAPVDLLRDVHIVDTPGTNAIFREHEQLTTEFVPRADLVLFVTSADRPFTETERAFLEGIRDWGKKIVIVVNKADILDTPAELDQVIDFVTDSARRLLGIAPEVFAVSARLALRAKQGDPSVWAASRFEPLERFIRTTLEQRSRFRLKLANPIGVGQALAHRYATIADERLELLKEDLALLEDIERQLAVYRDDLVRGYELRMTAVEKVLADMEARGSAGP
jgi:tRNA U34 5-carboxymethylaminomethyl modifying GTPase MnmE/TrmE